MNGQINRVAKGFRGRPTTQRDVKDREASGWSPTPLAISENRLASYKRDECGEKGRGGGGGTVINECVCVGGGK